MEQRELQKYILEQANIEVDHTRSWPIKILAFYVTINFGIVGALLTLRGQTPPIKAPSCVKIGITLFVVVLFWLALLILQKNHRIYLQHRNIQIHFQIEHIEEKYKDEKYKEKYALPDEWFELNKISLCARKKWWFYPYLMFLVTALTMGGVWFVG